MIRSRYLIPILILASLHLAGCSGHGAATPDMMSDTLPHMTPDYSGRPAVPRNIAPLRFRIDTPADAYQASIALSGSGAPEIVVNSSDGEILIPEKEWSSLLDRAAGSSVEITTATRTDGRWTAYPAMTVDIDTARLDDWLVYRLIYPGYELWSDMGIYQRCPATFEQQALLENKDAERQCMNCHSFAVADPSVMMLHVRGPKGGTAVMRPGKEPVKIKPAADGTPHGAAYPAWHPSGRYLAFAADEIQQFFHPSGSKTTEVVNMAGDMMVYDLDTGKGFTDSLMSGIEYIETFPTWSPDGSMLYYCRSNPLYTPAGIDSARYDLIRRPFDASTGRFTGVPEMVYEASAEEKSITVPRISPDGRWLLLTRSDYGNFMIWHEAADLCLIDLQADTIAPRPLDEINAPGQIDSYHSWSSDGRWMVFSSKRLDGLFARPFIARFDAATGRFSAPFVLPQASPSFYDDLLQSFNVPEFVSDRVPHSDTLRRLANMPAAK